MAYIGAPLVSTNFVLDQFTATADQTVFTLTRAPASAQSVLVGIDGVFQEPGTAYTVSGTTLTFTSGVPLGARVFCVHLGVTSTLSVPADGSVDFATLGSTLNGSVVQSSYAEYTANANLTPAIPIDDTIPQITEGTEVATVTITPRSAANKIRIRFAGFGAGSTTPGTVIAALFKDATASALTATAAHSTGADIMVNIGLEYEEVAGSTTARTYRIRAGGHTGTVRLNGNSVGRFFGGVARSTLVVEEIKA